MRRLDAGGPGDSAASKPLAAKTLIDHAWDWPYDFYHELVATDPVQWDDGLGAWVVSDYKTCVTVMRREGQFEREDPHLPGAAAAHGHVRMPQVIGGKLHGKVHNLLLSLLTDEVCKSEVDPTITRIANGLIDAFIGKGEVELVSAYCDLLPGKVAIALLDVNLDDTARERLRLARLNISLWQESRGERPDEAALNAADDTMRSIFLPVIEERRDSHGADLISQLWQRGREMIPDWSANDVYAGCLVYVGGGQIRRLLANLAYLLMTEPVLQSRIRDEGDQFIERLVDECLRLLGPAHYSLRRATCDQLLGGKQVNTGDRVIVLLAAADRDPARFVNPDDLALDGPPRPSHLAFGHGARFCVGSSLVKAEARVSLRIWTERLGELHFVSNAPLPEFVGGGLVRSFAPLHAGFDGG